MQILDPLVAILVALNILRIGWHLTRTAIKGLMDEADDELLESITTRLELARKDWCIDVHSLRIWSSGNLHHVDFHLIVPRYFDAERLHEVDEEYKSSTFADDSRPWDSIIHYDPCRPRHCSNCPVSPCRERSSDFKKRTPPSTRRLHPNRRVTGRGDTAKRGYEVDASESPLQLQLRIPTGAYEE